MGKDWCECELENWKIKRGRPDENGDGLWWLSDEPFDRINEMHYHFPLSSIPTVYVHTKEVAVRDNPFSAGQTFVGDYAWK